MGRPRRGGRRYWVFGQPLRSYPVSIHCRTVFKHGRVRCDIFWDVCVPTHDNGKSHKLEIDFCQPVDRINRKRNRHGL